jgi:hypothetical protein
VVRELLIEAVPVFDLVAVFVELIEPVDVREINALKVWAGDDDELFEIVALFVLVGLFGPLLVIKAEAENTLVAKGDSEFLEDRVLVFEGADVWVGAITTLVLAADNNSTDNKSNLIAFTTSYIKLNLSRF